MEINEYEAGMLDAVLEASAGRGQLDWTELMELFDGDEELAAAITDILVGMNLITKSGKETKTGLAEKIHHTDYVASFIEKGGFTALVKVDRQPVAEQPVFPEPANEQILPNREVVFEIFNNLPEKPSVEDEIPLSPKPEPIILTNAEKPTIEEVKSVSDVSLEQEITHLHLEQRQFEHRLREKDIIVQNLTIQNETLRRFRIFIWVLLGLVALLILGLIFRK